MSKLIMVIGVSIFLNACNCVNDHEKSMSNKEVVTLKNTTKHDPLKLMKKKEQDNKAQRKRNTVMLNGTKFKLINNKFEPSMQIYNISLHEFGMIKGSFVLVVSNTGSIDKSRFKEVTKIADKTFRVWFTNDVELLSEYKKLSQDANFSAVEVDIDYTAQSKNQTYE